MLHPEGIRGFQQKEIDEILSLTEQVAAIWQNIRKFQSEKYMQMADAMNNSIGEPRTDGKVSPKVQF